MTTIVLIHGRSQQGKDPAALRETWVRALDAGLGAAGAAAVDPSHVVLPFYGDVLHAAELAAAAHHEDIDLEAVREGRGRAAPEMPAEVAGAMSDVLRGMVEAQGDGVDEESFWDEKILSLPGAARVLRFLADRTRVDQDLIQRFVTDVAVYLTVARKEVLDVVRAAVDASPDRLLIVAHSLGGAVAADLLADEAVRSRTDAWMTVGDPLGIEGVVSNLVTPRVSSGPPWATVWDTRDIVALGHPLGPPSWSPAPENIVVDNPDGSAHSIEHYLAHPEAGRWLADHGAS